MDLQLLQQRLLVSFQLPFSPSSTAMQLQFLVRNDGNLTSLVVVKIKCGGQERCLSGDSSRTWWSVTMEDGGDQDGPEVSYLQKRASNDTVEREPALRGEVMSSILGTLMLMKRPERGSWIHKSGAAKRGQDWKHTCVSHLSIEKRDHLERLLRGKGRGPWEYRYFFIRSWRMSLQRRLNRKGKRWRRKLGEYGVMETTRRKYFKDEGLDYGITYLWGFELYED